jgi:hypothetical protein
MLNTWYRIAVAILIFFEDEGANRGRDGIKRRRNKTGR